MSEELISAYGKLSVMVTLCVVAAIGYGSLRITLPVTVMVSMVELL